MKNFIGHPNTQKLEAVEGEPGTGLYCYKYDEKNMSGKDISQILNVTEIILGTLEDTMVIMEPIDKKVSYVILAVKNRSNIKLGIKDLTKR